MLYTEAFHQLGYSVDSPRQDWTAENETGVCITLWQDEVHSKEGGLLFDTTIHGNPFEKWGHKTGNRKRIQHVLRALSEFGGYVDVVLVTGIPDKGVDDADPWIPEKRKGHVWRITHFDSETGHLRVETEKASDKADES